MKTRCYFCDKDIQRHAFDVGVGTLAFFLCPKHLKELAKHVKMCEYWP